MKGKYANRTENRRVAELEAQLVRLRAELAEEREKSNATLKELRTENAKLTAEMVGRAGELASAEVARRVAAFHEERTRRGLSDDIVRLMAMRKDRFMMNACRYLSMTRGEPPVAVLPLVLTWATDKNFRGAPEWDDFLLKLGVPVDGWVADRFKDIGQTWEKMWKRKLRKSGNWLAVDLDYAEAHPDAIDETFVIHPDYNPRWYPRAGADDESNGS